MKTPRLRNLLVPLAAMVPLSALHAAVNISNPAVPDPFTAVPPVTSWSTLSVGDATDAAITTVDQFDAKMIAAASAAAVITPLGSSGTFAAATGPSANIIARFNTGAQTTPVGITFLQTRPTTNDYTLLMATLSNATPGDLSAVRIAYDYSKFTEAAASTELIKSLRVFWSVSGTPGSWQLIPGLSVDTPGLVATPQPISANVILPAPLPSGGTMYLLWADQNATGTDASYHIDNFAASPGTTCVITGSDITPVRHPGGDPASPADDTVTFSTTITGSGDVGPGWKITAGPMLNTTGNYGDTVNFDLPIGDFAGGPLTLKVEDQTTAICFFEKTITAPPFTYAVTATSSPTITFSPAAVGAGSYVSPVATLGEPGWSGGTTGGITASNVQTQPPPSTETLKYFHMTTNGTSLTTDAVDVNALKGSYLKGELELSLYTTSGSGLEVGDAINARIEVAQDGDFNNTTAGNILTMNIKDVTTTDDATVFGASIAAANPYMNFGTAAGQNPFPATDFTFYKFSASTLIPAAASNPRARIVVQTIAGISNTEHLLIDNIVFKPNTDPTLEASIAGPGTWTNNGTVVTTDDSFTVPVNITSLNLGGSPGWNSNETPVRSGLYTDPNPVTFGPYPGRTPVNVQLSDQTNPAVTSGVIAMLPPAITFTLTPVAGSVLRQTNGPGDADDTVTFEAAISGSGGGPEFRMDSYPAIATTPILALTTVPTTITVTISPVPNNGDVVIIFRDSSYLTSGVILTVVIPAAAAPQYVIGKKDLGGGLSDVLTDATPPVEWINFPGVPAFEMTNGGGGATKVISSERIDLTGVSGNVNFSARLRAIDRSAGFELADTFLAELILDDDTVTPVNLITAYDTFAPANGVMNGTDTAIPAEDEFNVAQATDGSYLSDFNLSYTIPDNVTSAKLVITAVNNSPNETFVVENVLFTVSSGSGDADGDGVSDAYEGTMGTNANDPNDVLRLSQSAGNPNQINFPTVNGRFYRVYVSDDADEPSHLTKWKDSGLATFIGNGSSASFNITVAPGEARRFYRLHVMTTDGTTGIGDWPATVP